MRRVSVKRQVFKIIRGWEVALRHKGPQWLKYARKLGYLPLSGKLVCSIVYSKALPALIAGRKSHSDTDVSSIRFQKEGA